MAITRSQRELVDEFGLNEDQARAVTSLQRLARSWPRSLMLASMEGELCVLRNDESRMSGDGLNPDAVVATIKGIPNTGGAW